ncbi:MAG: ABC transporter permease [Anaerolineales bacterium]|nr:ABC transporter permease [Anaerolineales bacterium]
MARYIFQRLMIMFLMLFMLSLVVFVVLELPPGDFADRYVHDLRQSGAQVTADQVQLYRHMLGLDRPWYIRYLNWIGGIITRLDFGWSLTFRMPVTKVIGDRLLFTVLLSVTTITLSYLIAIPVGIYSAMRQYSIGDYFFTVLGYFGMATPAFLFALILLYISVIYFNTGVGGLFSREFQDQPWSWAKLIDFFKHIWMAVIVLGTSGAAFTIRTMRATMLDEKNQLYVTVARAKGLPERKLIWKYPVRAALNPVASTIGWELAEIVSGSPITATVLALPDIGPIFLKSLINQDVYLSGTILLFYSALTIIGTFLSDLLLAALDPRIRLTGGAP